jgi:ribosomal protein S2
MESQNEPYIYGVKNKIHIIDVQKTISHAEEAAKFMTEAAKEPHNYL